MKTYVALLRGINVGRAKRIAMADLRALMTGLGYHDVRTLLNSGNILFSSTEVGAGQLERKIGDAIQADLAVSTQVIVVSAAVLATIIDESPLNSVAVDSSRYLVAFTSHPANLNTAKPLLGQDWEAERLAIGKAAAYLWCPGGVHDSKLVKAFSRAMQDIVTTRNWSTVLKLQSSIATSVQR